MYEYFSLWLVYILKYAKYFEKQNDKNNVTPFEFIPYILG